MERAAQQGAQQIAGLRPEEYPSPEQRPKLKEHYFEFLRSSAVGKPAKDESTEALFKGLNSPVMGVLYNSTSKHPYYRVFASQERIAAESLLRYLNLVARTGPAHGMCSECESMFIKGKGDRKFCSEC